MNAPTVRCQVAQYPTSCGTRVAPRCGQPATWFFEESKAPGGPVVEEFHACDACADAVHRETSLEGLRLAKAAS